MRVLFALLLAIPAFAQQTNVSYSTDLNGRPREEGVSTVSVNGNVTTKTDLTRTVDGRLVPWESVEERVVSDDANGRVVERIIRRYSQDGRPSPPEKQQVRERKNADGTVSATTTTFEGDLNGSYRLAARVVSEASKSGDTTNTVTTVERQTVNGSFEVVEKRQRTADDATQQETVLRPDPQGRLRESARSTTESKEANGERLENTANYEIGYDGKLVLHSQSVARIRKNADGSETKEVDLYRRLPGRADPTATPALEERQVIEQSRSGNQLTETIYVQRPSINDPKRLGALTKLQERTCTGENCK